MTPCTMPSPRNQCGAHPGLGLEPLRTYKPASSFGKEPSTRRSNVSTSLDTGAKSPRNHHGNEGSTTVVDGLPSGALGRAVCFELPPHAATSPAPPNPAAANAPSRSNV